MLRALLGRMQFLFWCGGVLFCGIAIWTYLETRHFQATENSRLEEALRSKVPTPPYPSEIPLARERPIRKPGSLVGRIEIPRLNLSAIVLEGSDSRTLSLGVGRIPETSEPGQQGNVVLGGHRDTFFRPLRGIRSGDSINMVTPHGSYRYTVDWMKVVDPDNTALLKTTPQPSLTLVTCYPFHYIGPAPQRFIVRAHQETESGSISTKNDTQRLLDERRDDPKIDQAHDRVRKRGAGRALRGRSRRDYQVTRGNFARRVIRSGKRPRAAGRQAISGDRYVRRKSG